MPWLPRRVPDEVRDRARRRLASLTQPIARPEVALLETEEPSRRLSSPSPSADGGRPGLVARLPTTVRDGRVAVSRSAAVGLALLAAAALVLAGSYAWRARAVQATLPTIPSGAPSDAGASPSSSQLQVVGPSAVGEIVVDVAGKVRRPGVVRLRLGARVVDAIEAAGGVRGAVDLTPLNLARVLTDGEQVLVGVEGAAPPGSPGGGAGTPADAVIDLNTATLDQLDVLPGVGPVLAQRIIDWRTAHGRFSSIDELREVSGIGDARFADLSPRVRV